jgi:hypothetical protein
MCVVCLCFSRAPSLFKFMFLSLYFSIYFLIPVVRYYPIRIPACTHFDAVSIVFAITFGAYTMSAVLFESGGESDSQDGYTALICAAQWSHVDCVRLLIDAGADKEANTNVLHVMSRSLSDFFFELSILMIIYCSSLIRILSIDQSLLVRGYRLKNCMCKKFFSGRIYTHCYRCWRPCVPFVNSVASCMPDTVWMDGADFGRYEGSYGLRAAADRCWRRQRGQAQCALSLALFSSSLCISI